MHRCFVCQEVKECLFDAYSASDMLICPECYKNDLEDYIRSLLYEIETLKKENRNEQK